MIPNHTATIDQYVRMSVKQLPYVCGEHTRFGEQRIALALLVRHDGKTAVPERTVERPAEFTSGVPAAVPQTGVVVPAQHHYDIGTNVSVAA